MSSAEQLRWWQTRWFVAAAAFISTIPLWWPDVPPLVDLPGHMGRYRVQLDIPDHPHLAEWYSFRWQLIGNLGIDLLIEAFARLFGLEGGVKLIVMAIPALIVTGLLWIAREVHGRIPATALFALPLSYCYPLQFGFVNYALSMGLALNLFALWLRLARQRRFRLRAAIFVPVSCLLWLCHTFGWGVLGVLAFSAELIRRHDEAGEGGGIVRRWLIPWIRAGLGCLPLAPPVLLMVFWRSGEHVSGQTFDWFNWPVKLAWVVMVLRERFYWWDVAATTVLYLMLFKGVTDKRLEYSRNLLLSALFLLAVFLLMPRVVFGSAYADMRLIPFVIALALIAIRPRPGLSMRGAATLAVVGLAFFAARLGGSTAAFAMYDRTYDRALAALPRVPVGARVVTFVGRACADEWAYSRLEHIPAMLLVRRLAYSNDQWSMPGAQLLTTRYAAARGFAHDPSQMVTKVQCSREFWRPIDEALTRFPRDAFDYVWILQPPPYDPALLRGLTPVWRDGRDMLLRVDDRTQPQRLNGVNASR